MENKLCCHFKISEMMEIAYFYPGSKRILESTGD